MTGFLLVRGVEPREGRRQLQNRGECDPQYHPEEPLDVFDKIGGQGQVQTRYLAVMGWYNPEGSVRNKRDERTVEGR